MGKIEIREGQPDDAPLLLEFIRGLADYEHLLEQVDANLEELRRTIFIDKMAEVLIAEYDGDAAGYALFFHNYSTFKGKAGLYIEDLFVKPELRGKGVGKALFKRLAGIAAGRNCWRIEWSCLDWNTSSINFYKSLGAVPLSAWTTYRLTDDKFKTML
ncbi:MAG: GNAT family N-acetyltransferase [Spirochaetaceae bacterium]|jgi:GNAT superfamily N-acetyltransferase|nr:GNAT family N-acetyltransferase [Spirochaetaceae bacterium]